MTPFAALLRASGLSQREAAAVCGVSPATMANWCGARRVAAPALAIAALARLVAAQVEAGRQIADPFDTLAGEHGRPSQVKIWTPADDASAQRRGFPTVSAWSVAAAHAIAALHARGVAVTLVPEGSTPAVQVAEAAREAG